MADSAGQKSKQKPKGLPGTIIPIVLASVLLGPFMVAALVDGGVYNLNAWLMFAICFGMWAIFVFATLRGHKEQKLEQLIRSDMFGEGEMPDQTAQPSLPADDVSYAEKVALTEERQPGARHLPIKLIKASTLYDGATTLDWVLIRVPAILKSILAVPLTLICIMILTALGWIWGTALVATLFAAFVIRRKIKLRNGTLSPPADLLVLRVFGGHGVSQAVGHMWANQGSISILTGPDQLVLDLSASSVRKANSADDVLDEMVRNRTAIRTSDDLRAWMAQRKVEIFNRNLVLCTMTFGKIQSLNWWFEVILARLFR